jgi:hypothetical protein
VNEALAQRKDLERVHLAEGHSNRTNQANWASELPEGGSGRGINQTKKALDFHENYEGFTRGWLPPDIIPIDHFNQKGCYFS